VLSTVEPAEHRQRQARARRAAAERGVAALVAVSRGGGTHDRAGDVLWLTGLATSQSFVPDLPGHWRATGHVVVVVPVDGPVTAVVESDELVARAVADEVVVADDLIAGAATALAAGLARGARQRVGVMGADATPFPWWTALNELLRAERQEVVLEDADDLGLALRRVKSPAEQALLRAAGRLGSRAMAAALGAAVPEARESDVAAALVQHVVREGGAVYDVVISSGASSVALGPHGGPAGPAGWTTRRLAAGELLRVDAYGSVGGYLFDFARSVVVGGAATTEQSDLIDALRTSVLAGIESLRPGVRLSDVARACEDALARSPHARRHGMPEHLMGGFWGHGLGLSFEPPWLGPGSHEIVEPGWCLAVERRAAVPGLGGAQYEDDVLVGPDGAELLTIDLPPGGRHRASSPTCSG
jgi:Xaa-Pro aminopeptidase